MTVTQKILNYASEKRGSFRRKDLLRSIIAQNSHINDKSIDVMLKRLLSAGELQRTGHGEYRLGRNRLPEAIYHPSHFEKDLYTALRQRFPLLDVCIWSPKVLSSLMLHVPDIGYTFVDVEKDGMESVFHALQSMDLKRNILLSPSKTDCERYLTGSDAIVVRQLIGRSPVEEVDGCTVPLIEKILTDAAGDEELMFAAGSESYIIFENALESFNVNRSRMLSYAARRNRKEKIEKILKTLDHDKP